MGNCECRCDGCGLISTEMNYFHLPDLVNKMSSATHYTVLKFRFLMRGEPNTELCVRVGYLNSCLFCNEENVNKIIV